MHIPEFSFAEWPNAWDYQDRQIVLINADGSRHVLFSDGSAWRSLDTGGGGDGLADGNYVDITVSGLATVMTINNDAVTFGKIQNITSDRLLGRDTASSGNVEEITVGGGLEFTGATGIQRSALTGDVTASAGSNATTVAPASITLAKMADLAQDQFIGRVTASTGVPQTATITSAARTVLDDTSVSAMVDTLGGGAATGTGVLVRATSPALITPNLGTPSAATLTNATGLPVSTGISGLGSDVATFLATPSSANLAAAVTGETGSGALVFATSPALTTPNIGTPSAGTLTSCTGLPISTGVSGLGANVATFLATPSSANLRAAMSDEDGDSALLFANAPATLSTGTNLVRTTHGNRYLICSTAATHTVEDDTTGGWQSGDVLYGDNTSAGNVVLQGDGTATLTAETDMSLTVSAGRSWSLRRTGANAWIGGALTAGGGGGSGTVTNTGGNLTSNSVVLGAGTVDTKVVAGIVTDGTSKVTLGVAGSVVGSVGFNNATSGQITLQPVTGALGTVTLSMPAATDTLVGRATTDTLTNKTLTSPTLTTPVLGTPSSGTLTNCTGLPVSGGISGLGTGVATFLATPSSANLRSALTDETGTGGAVFAIAPTLTGAIAQLNAIPGTDDTFEGTVVIGRNAGATIAQWEAVYLDSSGTWQLADANGSGTYPCRGLATAAYSSGNAAVVLDDGVARNDAWAWTIGGDVYLSTTAGGLTQTAPSASGDKIQKIGYALSADSIRVMITGEYLTVA